VRGRRLRGGARGDSNPGRRGGRRSCFRHGCRRSGARLRLRRASALRRATFGFPARRTFSGRPCPGDVEMKKEECRKEKSAPSRYIPSEVRERMLERDLKALVMSLDQPIAQPFRSAWARAGASPQPGRNFTLSAKTFQGRKSYPQQTLST